MSGCDPAVAILADWLARRRSPVNAVAIPCSSQRALRDLVDGRAHVAGVHLRDQKSGEYNLAPIRRALGHRRSIVVNFARWEFGLATAPGNPLAIHGFADLARPGLRIVNREDGAGARSALDEALAEHSLKPDRDCGIRVRSRRPSRSRGCNRGGAGRCRSHYPTRCRRFTACISSRIATNATTSSSWRRRSSRRRSRRCSTH